MNAQPEAGGEAEAKGKKMVTVYSNTQTHVILI